MTWPHYIFSTNTLIKRFKRGAIVVDFSSLFSFLFLSLNHPTAERVEPEFTRSIKVISFRPTLTESLDFTRQFVSVQVHISNGRRFILFNWITSFPFIYLFVCFEDLCSHSLSSPTNIYCLFMLMRIIESIYTCRFVTALRSTEVVLNVLLK